MLAATPGTTTDATPRRKWSGRKATNWDAGGNSGHAHRVRYANDKTDTVVRQLINLMASSGASGSLFLKLPDGSSRIFVNPSNRAFLAEHPDFVHDWVNRPSTPGKHDVTPTAASISNRRKETPTESADYSALVLPAGMEEVEVCRVEGHNRRDVAGYYLTCKMPGAKEVIKLNETATPSEKDAPTDPNVPIYPHAVSLPRVAGSNAPAVCYEGKPYFDQTDSQHAALWQQIGGGSSARRHKALPSPEATPCSFGASNSSFFSSTSSLISLDTTASTKKKRSAGASSSSSKRSRKPAAPAEQHPLFVPLLQVKQRWLRQKSIWTLKVRVERMRAPQVLYPFA
jgi:hypothetical protein